MMPQEQTTGPQCMSVAWRTGKHPLTTHDWWAGTETKIAAIACRHLPLASTVNYAYGEMPSGPTKPVSQCECGICMIDEREAMARRQRDTLAYSPHQHEHSAQCFQEHQTCGPLCVSSRQVHREVPSFMLVFQILIPRQHADVTQPMAWGQLEQ